MKPSYKIILYRYLFALVLLFATQIIFYLLNSTLFNVAGFKDFANICVGNIRFGLSTLSVFLAPYLVFSLLPITIKQKKWYRIFLSVLYFIGVEFILVCNLIDCGYYRFTFKRLTFDIFNYLGVGGDFNSLIPQFVRDYWHIFLIFIILNIVMYVLDWRIRKRWKTESMQYTKSFILSQSIVLVLVLIVSVIFQRGGFQVRPIGLLQASEYTSTQNASLVLNTPFTIYRTIGKAGLQTKQFYTEEELEKIYTPISKPAKEVWADTLFNEPLQMGKTNVVMIIIESYAAEYLSTYNKNGATYTPFIDSLAKHSIVFQGYSNGKRSIDGIPAVVSSMPLLNEESYITSSYGENKLGSIASLLKDNGYSTAFYHGGYNGTMNFDGFTNHVGYENYYGKNEYNNNADYDGNWGIFDEPFLQYMGKKLNTTQNPFLATVFTLSSHHPYTIPAQHKGRFPKGTLIVHETVAYTDYAVRRFFEYAKQQDWFENTLFVITADHSALTGTKEFQTALGLYRIPVIFYSPKLKHGLVSNDFMQQIDIFPTICDLLHNEKPFFSFGKSIFSDDTHFYVYFSNGEYIVRLGDYVSKYREGYKTQLFNAVTDPDMRNDISSQNEKITKQHTIFTQALIQQYNNRLIKNQTTIK
ncbi:MAG: sulfatase-like hydrolase/transferase [Bacteroidales bacterium]|nr:sulfatase-like hydrolase/transferase [Bacteroidales bacterium]